MEWLAAEALVATGGKVEAARPSMAYATAIRDDDVVVALTLPTYGAKLVHDARLDPDGALAIRVDLRLEAQSDERSVAAIASNAAAVVATRNHGDGVVGFHSRANRCASAISSEVIWEAARSRSLTASGSCAAAKLSHMYPRTTSCCTP